MRKTAGTRLTERDLAALDWIADMTVVSTGQLGRWMYLHKAELKGLEIDSKGTVSAQVVRKWAARMERAGFTGRSMPLTAQPPVIWLTPLGAEVIGQVGRGRKRVAPVGHIPHDLRLVDAALRGQMGGWTWRRPDRLSPDEMARRKKAGYDTAIWDALISHTDSRRAGVEIEVTQKSRERLVRILRARYDEIAEKSNLGAVVYYVSTSAIEQRVEEVWAETCKGGNVDIPLRVERLEDVPMWGVAPEIRVDSSAGQTQLIEA